MMGLETGQTVLYKLSDYDADAISARRTASNGVLEGNPPYAGSQFPAHVVATWGPDTANLQVVLDGNDTYWATSRQRGNQPGQWEPQHSAVAEAVSDVAHGHWPSFRSDTGTQASVSAEATGSATISGNVAPGPPADFGGTVPVDPAIPLYDELTAEQAGTPVADPTQDAQPPASSAPDTPDTPDAAAAPDAAPVPPAPADPAPQNAGEAQPADTQPDPVPAVGAPADDGMQPAQDSTQNS